MRIPRGDEPGLDQHRTQATLFNPDLHRSFDRPMAHPAQRGRDGHRRLPDVPAREMGSIAEVAAGLLSARIVLSEPDRLFRPCEWCVQMHVTVQDTGLRHRRAIDRDRVLAALRRNPAHRLTHPIPLSTPRPIPTRGTATITPSPARHTAGLRTWPSATSRPNQASGLLHGTTVRAAMRTDRCHRL
ncbi:hypothetical protein BN6_58010 [Saccharothrix espanaensis DSM 44229]|uniref:Uncharacterized protein n=1 Tax=Saccharothrix espanaensis (strain ATCC 51144 / DSM 44229 / JCM 9112 / NBRC 15066 / NRRL 15764) TaxID=1179773 RepID=K0K8A2_SACES|nr:hypothetical protein BN6_58010 [Saccharothrix espanaensis DSM 44229]